VRVAKLPFSKVACAVEADEARGFMKAVVDGGSPILGRQCWAQLVARSRPCWKSQ
jgi:pyruvate/2-oxoglutarate dehydrogenase complex dihydrolipoamide dehydrogenase (E3) component